MKIIGYNYAVIHTAVHLLFAGILYYSVQPDLALDYAKLAAVALGTAVVDLDHMSLWLEKGFKGYLELRSIEEFGKPRKYAFHTLMLVFLLIGASSLVVVRDYFFIGLFASAAVLHLAWDFAEDVFIFKMGYRHWI